MFANFLSYGIPETVALAVVAVLGYLFGRRQPTQENTSASDDIQRATAIALELESIAGELRTDLAFHRTQVENFKKQLRVAATSSEQDAWAQLRSEAEAILGPTLELAGQLSSAYDKIRQQSQSLSHYTTSRIDPLTGLSNGRALEEQLEIMLSRRSPRDRESVCSVAMLTVAEVHTERAPDSPAPLASLAQAVSRQLRGSDFAARYGSDELVVVMPKTPLSGACVFGRRFRATSEVQLGMQVCCGVAEAQPGETARSLLARADAALYSARASKPGAQYLHNGSAIRSDTAAPLPCRPPAPDGEDPANSKEEAAACEASTR
ncbi:Response regulator PleD [Posidoniimonas polymericola]|uniref:diguanylate cyclase n=1 Tax=Posidoniimonas polymericola TaxID=2528002 RepID=A0A5C5YDZ5_9BACT|nr:GGDEF domain-containing protein [Posidoniimonas polymericola]TWT72681.1 Response regulator PleD [Posidoniimonas polymericola]